MNLESVKYKITLVSVLLMYALTLFLTGCKEPFQAEINEKTDAIAVDGSLIKGMDKQTITITWSTPLNDISYLPVVDCQVKIVDELENEFYFAEESDGIYTATIDDNILLYGRKYKLVFITPEGSTYESAYETIIETATVDSVYPVVEKVYNSVTQEDEDYIRFYLDLKAPETGSRYYRWELAETYEIHSYYHIDAYYDGDEIYRYPPFRDSLFYCWITSEIDELYSSNTVNLVINEKKKIPLNSFPVTSRRMSVRYSLLIEQYALNEKAYDYWNQKKTEIQESGGLYTAQPGQGTSNITNINDDTEKVLGYFWASSLSEKRIFYEDPVKYRKPLGYCDTAVFDTTIHDNGIYPIYLTLFLQIPIFASQECFDCTLLGGSLEKPDFW